MYNVFVDVNLFCFIESEDLLVFELNITKFCDPGRRISKSSYLNTCFDMYICEGGGSQNFTKFCDLG